MVELAQDAEVFRGRGVNIAVVLPQRGSAVSGYLADRSLPYDVLIDENRQVAKAYGVWHRIGLDAWNTSRPAVFLIDRDRSIRYSFIGASQREFPALEELLRVI